MPRTSSARASVGGALLGALHGTAVRMLRRLGLDRNPLRRATDRLETATRLLVVLVCLGSAPLIAAVGFGVHDHLASTAAREAASLVREDATVRSAPNPAGGRSAFVPVTAKVAWTTSTGSAHVATTTVPAGARRGDHVTVWTTPAGVLTSPPAAGSEVLASTLAVVATLVVGVTLLAWAALALARRLLDRARYRAWAREWVALSDVRT